MLQPMHAFNATCVELQRFNPLQKSIDVMHFVAGEYPLSFAAATGQKDIVSYLKRHNARVNHDCDM